MEKREPCRFCDIMSGNYQYGVIDEPFAQDAEFSAIASIGALVEGWTLIVPNQHQLSMRKVYPTASFVNFVNGLLPVLADRYRTSVIAFEHGANAEGSITACGTDHAHLHLLPLGDSLLQDISGSGLKWIRCHSSLIGSCAGDSEYLFYCELNTEESWNDPIGYLHVLDQPISQYFRRLIANKLGQKDVADYKRYPYFDVAKNTRMVLGGQNLITISRNLKMEMFCG